MKKLKIHETPLFDHVKGYHFELKHLLIILIILLCFHVMVSFVHKISIVKFLNQTQKWYQQDFAERIANLTTTSLEMLVETALSSEQVTQEDDKKIIQAFNIILSQQVLQHYVQEVCILLSHEDRIVAIDNGRELFSYLFGKQVESQSEKEVYLKAIELYNGLKNQLMAEEQIYSILEGQQTFHVFVPFVPKGEFVGVVYMKNTPAFELFTGEIISSYNETSLIFTVLILFGLLAMFYISSYTVKERDDTQKILYEERERQLKKHIHLQKEALFAKRIYHTHHKAEKVMGFIKEDLNALSESNIDEIKYRVTKYANFISRVIYDMKWYEPPVHAVRGSLFKTNLNELIRFIVDHIFKRVSLYTDNCSFELDLDEKLPTVPMNEFVIWEIIEPLIQNSIDHSGDHAVCIKIQTKYFKEKRQSKIIVADDGEMIQPDLLVPNEQGIKRIFLENITTKKENQSSGYGCYIAYEIATQRCGWQLDAENLEERGCRFIVTIPQ